MPTKTIEHKTAQETIRNLRRRVAGLELEKSQMLVIIGKSRFDDEPAPLCGICGDEMEGGGDFAVCLLCNRFCVRETVWRMVPGPGGG